MQSFWKYLPNIRSTIRYYPPIYTHWKKSVIFLIQIVIQYQFFVVPQPSLWFTKHRTITNPVKHPLSALAKTRVVKLNLPLKIFSSTIGYSLYAISDAKQINTHLYINLFVYVEYAKQQPHGQQLIHTWLCTTKKKQAKTRWHQN